MIERGSNTIKTTLYLQLIGIKVIEEYEYNWKKIKKNNKEAVKTQSLWQIPKPDTIVQVCENEIFEGVK